MAETILPNGLCVLTEGIPGVRSAAETAVRGAGYAEVRIDPEGYRRGRLNEALRIVEVVGDSKPGI